MSVLGDSTILVTGGTGSFGRAFVRYVLRELEPRQVVVFSRDELKQYDLRQQFQSEPRLRLVIGDVRDRDSLSRVLRGVDHVLHAAALKQVDTAERNAFEYARTNIDGSQNVVEAAVANGVRRVVALSTDKASSPINLYGATKMVADKLFTSADAWAAGHGTRFSVVRYGNVIGSRGSVIPYFQRLSRERSSLPVTDKRMTRFWITLVQAVRFVVASFESMRGGELFVPRTPSMKITDLAEAIAPGCPIYEIGIRPGEKLHEEMIAPGDSHRTFELGDRFVVLPTVRAADHEPDPAWRPVAPQFSYRSDTNSSWLSVEHLRAMLAREAV